MHILTALNGKFTRFSKKGFYKLSRWHFVEAITLFVWKSLDLKTKKSYSMTDKAGASMPFFTKEKKKKGFAYLSISARKQISELSLSEPKPRTPALQSHSQSGERPPECWSVCCRTTRKGQARQRKMQALQTLVGKIKQMLVTLHVCLTHPLTSQWWSAATNCSLKWPHHLYSIEFSSHSFYIIDAYLSAHHWTD